MKILVPEGFTDYDLLDSGDTRRLERFGKYTLSRPDPQAIWNPHLSKEEWDKADFIYTDSWQGKEIPDRWEISYKDLTFYAKLTPFKHTGIFPEQAVNWDWIQNKIKQASSSTESRSLSDSDSRLHPDESGFRSNNNGVRVLNLFGYTGIASLVCAKAGAHVTHIDASRPSIGWAKDNQALSGLSDKPIRWILDDALKFCEREVRRGNHYDGIIMDPPSYGHGPDGEKWDFFEDFPKLLSICQQLLSDKPLFFLVNAYAISASSIMLENILREIPEKFGGALESGELCLKEKNSERLLSTGIFARWHR